MAYDVLVIGGGPAGLSAAQNVRARGKTALVVSNPLEENPLWKAKEVDNYLGLPRLSGAELLTAFQRHAESSGAEFLEGRALSALRSGESWYVSVGNTMVQGKAVVLAAGVVRGKKLPGEAELLGRGVSYCATCDGMLYRGKRVAVLGWTPSAEKEAAFLEGIGCQVLYLDKPRDCAIRGAEKVEAVTCGGVTEAVEAVFLLRPAMAPGDLFPGLETGGGFVAVDREMRTNLPGVFAAGDCTGGPLQVSKAVGEGLTAGQKAAAFAAAVK
ncbi:NAD(P)/FAD-dependent oxidoreductase [Oscillibacter sp.]|jgi:thioredoxin reductase (NADPH)|uniref:NAD(P)/FAD-dependent oxidoreductase n=1 Tax=Oscillibacter sp. TaxID=1945593 RepID=UPI00216F0EA8|nr:NAD(P)/FAD-dependent oxidoreductase [Oscillibacter sp.]MCI9241441.1 NAD(P)/FAD-dependent oxidoreductase [Oscillibacter sp.]MCI9300609.1 NAD(P)/FAD-dependent oxidoreductase [Oscillibacter sp.]MCI9461677.1 NAD(P)/FAD-dependent oxidoreductase [Oscillibacter sp.]